MKSTRDQYRSLLSRCLRCRLQVGNLYSDTICPLKDFFFVYNRSWHIGQPNRVYARTSNFQSHPHRSRRASSIFTDTPVERNADTREVLISGRKNASCYWQKSLRTIRRMAINVAAIGSGSMDTSEVLICFSVLSRQTICQR